MLQAVSRSIAEYQTYAKRTHRRMALVTDESGEPVNNDRFLDPAIKEAKSARCKIYVLGREAVFGYPYAFGSDPGSVLDFGCMETFVRDTRVLSTGVIATAGCRLLCLEHSAVRVLDSIKNCSSHALFRAYV